jgi:site-specific DNA-methyltransferase (adenine-specific)
MNIVHNMDCLLFMKNISDKYYELAIVDPPYNIVSQQKRGIGSRIDITGKMNDWNHIKPSKEFFDELFRISQNQIVWGANNFTLPNSEYFIIWDKMQTVDNFASAELAYTNIKKPAQIFHYSIHQCMSDRKKDNGKIHPTQKPVELYRWLLQNYAKPKDKIFDSHVGSGSSRCACYELGFGFEGCELDYDYWQAQEERFKIFKAKVDNVYYIPDSENDLFRGQK